VGTGHLCWTMYILDFIGEPELRQSVQNAFVNFIWALRRF
jgi:hypothetical protein